MAINKNPKPIKTSRRKPARLMEYQDTKSRGDSTAARTRRVTFSTTDEIGDAIDNAAHDMRMSRSRLIEAALVEYLKL